MRKACECTLAPMGEMASPPKSGKHPPVEKLSQEEHAALEEYVKFLCDR
jgi:hypothetical protein